MKNAYVLIAHTGERGYQDEGNVIEGVSETRFTELGSLIREATDDEVKAARGHANKMAAEPLNKSEGTAAEGGAGGNDTLRGEITTLTGERDNAVRLAADRATEITELVRQRDESAKLAADRAIEIERLNALVDELNGKLNAGNGGDVSGHGQGDGGSAPGDDKPTLDGLNKDKLRAVAKAEGVEGLADDATNAQIRAAIEAKRAA